MIKHPIFFNYLANLAGVLGSYNPNQVTLQVAILASATNKLHNIIFVFTFMPFPSHHQKNIECKTCYKINI